MSHTKHDQHVKEFHDLIKDEEAYWNEWWDNFHRQDPELKDWPQVPDDEDIPF